MTRDDLLPPEVQAPTERENPKVWQFGEHELKLRYRFEPGAPDDGVTVDVPAKLLPDLTSDEFDWLVPGLRVELIAELIRSLPKNIRRNVVPAADWAQKALQNLPEHPTEPLLPTLAKTLRSLSGTHMTADDFDSSALSSALRMTYRVIDEAGRTMGLGLDLAALKQKLVPAAPGAPVAKAKVDVEKQKRVVVDAIRGLIASPADYVAEHLSNEEKLAIAGLGYKGTAGFVDDVIRALIEQHLAELGLEVEQAQVAQTVSAQAIEESFGLAKLLLKISTAAREASKAISDIQDFSLLYVLTNEKNHIAQLLQPNLVSVTGLARLARLPIYLQASKMRMQKLVENSERDRVAELELNEALALFEKAGGQIPLAANSEPKIIETRWMLEELRVSLFAQSLGTAQSVSVQRIKKALGDN